MSPASYRRVGFQLGSRAHQQMTVLRPGGHRQVVGVGAQRRAGTIRRCLGNCKLSQQDHEHQGSLHLGFLLQHSCP